MKAHIFVAEDEKNLAETLALNLNLSGYEVTLAASGSEGLRVFSRQPEAFSLALLDVMLPDMDGLELCKAVKQLNPRLPVIFLTARQQPSDKIAGLRLGADDYITKPFDLEELLLRISNLLKRSQTSPIASISFGGNEIDFQTYVALTSAGNQITLSRREIGLLELLTSNPNKVISRDEIIEKLWEPHENASARTIDNFILNFRKYFEQNPRTPVHFHSVRGVGYKFNP